MLKDLLDAMGFAWGELFDLPLQNIFRNSSSGNGETSFTLAAFPLLGFLVGALVALISSLVTVIFNPHAGGVLFALLSWAVLCFKDSGRGDEKSTFRGAGKGKIRKHPNFSEIFPDD